MKNHDHQLSIIRQSMKVAGMAHCRAAAHAVNYFWVQTSHLSFLQLQSVTGCKMAVYTASPKTVETLQALLTPMRIEKAGTRKCVPAVVRVCSANALESTVAADREA